MTPQRRAPWATRFLESRASLQFVLWAILILFLKAYALHEPPVWDSAMGIFPAAIHLSETGFDIRALLLEPTWWEGGPNVHALSLFTWFVAFVLWITADSELTFLVVHLTTYLLVAWSLTLFTRALARETSDAALAIAAAVMVLATPLVLVQVGAMYTETWVMAFAIAAWAYWQAGRASMASLFCVVGLFVKFTGIAAFACVVGLLVVSPRPAIRVRLGLLGVLGAALIVAIRLPSWLGAVAGSGSGWGDAKKLTAALVERVGAIPDVTLLVGLAVIGALVHAVQRIANGSIGNRDVEFDPISGARWFCVAMPVLFCLGIARSVHTETIFLPRYLVPIVPFSIATILIVARRAIRRPYLLGALLIACLAQAVNYDGHLYAKVPNRFSIVERSHAYRDMHRCQLFLVEALVHSPRDVPIFVTKDLDYMLSSPKMGYANSRMDNLIAIYRSPHATLSLDQYPDEFFLARSTSTLGGGKMTALVRAARKDPTREVFQWKFVSGPHSSSLFRIRRRPAESSSTPDAAPAPHAS